MGRRVRDFIEIRDFASLDTLIETLTDIRNGLPEAAEAEVKLRGDDIFGRQLAIAYFRPQTAEEIECDARYAEAHRHARQRETEQMQQELSAAARVSRARPAGLRAVA